MKNLAVIPAVIALLRAYFDRRAGRGAKAKVKIERIQERYPDMFEFLDAYYGFILITERNVEGAKYHFRKSLTGLPAKKSDDQKYIEIYCRLFLECQNDNFDWELMVSEAEQLKPDSLTQRLLVLPTKERIISSLTA